MAIGYSSPRIASPPRRLRSRLDRHHLPESLATLAGRFFAPVRLDFLRPLSLRRNHSRKRNVKPVSTTQHNTDHRKVRTDFRVFAPLGLGLFKPKTGRAALAQRLFQLR